MKKLIIACALSVLVLFIANNTQAAPTIDYEDVVNDAAGQPDTYFVPEGVSDGDIWGSSSYRLYDEDWDWTHAFTPASEPDVIISATLEILAWDVDEGEVDVISLDGIELGPLDVADDAWSTTVFDLSSLLGHLDESILISMDIDSTHDHPYWGVALGSSTLKVSYEPKPEPLPEPISAPAPGAVLLGSIGVGFVSWLRRRRTL